MLKTFKNITQMYNTAEFEFVDIVIQMKTHLSDSFTSLCCYLSTRGQVWVESSQML